MKRTLAMVIIGIFLVTGLIRVGVTAIVISQLMGWWQLGGEAAVAVTETQRFIGDAQTNLVGFTSLSYFLFLSFMGAIVSAGAIGQIWRKRWGLVLIALYLFCHAFLFLNFMTINPKIGLLLIALLLALILWWTNKAVERPRAPLSN